MSRLLYGNLDAEMDWGPPDLRELPAPVRSMISAAATTMAAFARPGDLLWVPALIDSKRLPALPGIHRPTLVTGEPPTDITALLAWGATPAVDALRSRIAPDSRAAEQPPDLTSTWIETLWQTATDPVIAARVNHRTFAAALCRDLDIALPGSAVLDDLDRLDAHLIGGGAEGGFEQRWVIKAPHSASGRLRLRQQGTTIEPSARVRAGRLFDRYGPLVFEPWLDRVADFGCVGQIDDSGHQNFPPHVLDCDAAGVWRGLHIDDHATIALDDAQQRALADTVDAVGKALHAAGYRGPFGIDAYLYRDASGAIKLHPLSEINARVSFGHVGRALLERCGEGRGVMRLASRPVPAASNIVPLLLPADTDATAAWLELPPAMA